MITDTRTQGDLTAAESLFNSGHLGSIGDRSNHVTYVEPAIRHPNERADVQRRSRLAHTESLAVSAEGMTMTKVMAAAGSIDKGITASSRAAANVAAWRTYLPEDCVVAMIKDGWHRST